MKTFAITGAASGIGRATAAQLQREGHRTIGVDLQPADTHECLTADLSTPEGRRAAIDGILARCDGRLDGLVPCAGLSGLPDRPGSLLVSLNYFGSIELIDGLQEALAAAGEASVVGLCSNSTTTAPNPPLQLVEALNGGDEQAARAIGDEVGSIAAYPATKMALARWLRARAVQEDWIGRGINLNAIAPGKTETAMVAEGMADPIIGQHMDKFPMPIGRNGRPEEIAELICFLLSERARFIVGSVFFIDGGTDALLRTNDYPAPWLLSR
jgi:NAD(P)-dependent dehydrogenase (short-subunit alcohol dehydrogenase family)